MDCKGEIPEPQSDTASCNMSTPEKVLGNRRHHQNRPNCAKSGNYDHGNHVEFHRSVRSITSGGFPKWWYSGTSKSSIFIELNGILHCEPAIGVLQVMSIPPRFQAAKPVVLDRCKRGVAGSAGVRCTSSDEERETTWNKRGTPMAVPNQISFCWPVTGKKPSTMKTVVKMD